MWKASSCKGYLPPIFDDEVKARLDELSPGRSTYISPFII